MSSKYIIEKLKKLWNRMDIYIQPNPKWYLKFVIILDFLISIPIYGLGINDYLQYEFYKKRHADRKTFVVHRKRMKIVKTFNREDNRVIFDNKEKFNEVFTEYIGREWLDMKVSNFTSFKNFVNKLDKFIVKPSAGSHGKGISFIHVNEIKDLKKLYEDLKEEGALLEEVISQHEEMSEFNPTSVNTLRVVTLLCPDNKVRVMTANLRMGNGKRYADNFHHNGIASLLDVETGIVITMGIDRDFNRYILHPYSGKQIIGFQVPYWENVVEKCKQAAKVMPTVGYVGWDVAIGSKGKIYIIEGNAAADPDISQMPDQIGKWPLYEKFVKER